METETIDIIGIGAIVVGVNDKSLPDNIKSDGTYWPCELEVIKSLLEQDSVYFDVGANYGIQAVYVSQFSDGDIYCFEPSPDIFPILEENVAALDTADRFHLLQVAVGDSKDSDETISFYPSTTNYGCGSLSKDNVPNPQDAIEVDVMSIDQVVAGLKISKIDLIKIDVEGLESQVISGAVDTLERLSPQLWFEFWPEGILRAGADPIAMLNDLIQSGYALKMYDILNGIEIDSESEAIVQYCNQLSINIGDHPLECIQPLVYILATKDKS